MSRREGSNRRAREKSNRKQKMNAKINMNRRREGGGQEVDMNMIIGGRRKE